MPAPRILPPAAGPVLLGALVLFSAYMAYEVWRWTSGNRAMLTPGQFRRRIFTGLLLEVDLVLWLLANPAIASFRRANPEHWGAPTLLYLLTATLLVFTIEYVKMLLPWSLWRVAAHGFLGWALFPLRYLDLLQQWRNGGFREDCVIRRG